MNDPYAFPEDLRRLISSSRNHLTNNNNNNTTQQPLSLYASASSSFPPPFNNNSYDPIMQIGDAFYPRAGFTHHYDYYSSSSINPIPIPIPIPTTTASSFAALETNSSHNNNNNKANWFAFDPSNNRWPRQETLSLLEIRSRLHSKFKDNNHKAPLWNEISRIMAEEFGYQRSGKKCKEKFENLYKYYKKTKEGKASRQDGKHYRFFRQLEAICGESSTTHHHASTSDNTTLHHAANAAVDSHQTPSFTINQENVINIGDHQNLNNNFKYSESLTSFSNSSEFEITSSCENNGDEDLSAVAHMMKQSKEKGLEDQRQSDDKKVRKSWRVKVEEIVDSHMRNIIETQDTWMEKMLSVVEQREQEMALKEEERKRKESMRFDKEIHELWAKEKAWVEARDAALLEVVRKHIGIENKEALVSNKNKSQVNDTKYGYPFESVDQRWTEMEISSLIQLRTSFEQRVKENGDLDDGVWDEIGEKMVYMGFDRNGIECKKIWDEISMSLRRTVDCGVKTRPWCLGLKVTDDDEI